MKLMQCPCCGSRPFTEFHYGGERRARPELADDMATWIRYIYFRKNAAGRHVEWWYHPAGCKRWFLAERDTITNAIFGTYLDTQGRPTRPSAFGEKGGS